MLKTIAIKQLRLGMFVQEMQGAWIDHPFWRKSFLLSDADDLRQLQASRIPSVTIDTSKGLDVAVDGPVFSPAPAAATDAAPQAKALHAIRKPARISAAEERERALKLVQASKTAITSMFDEARMGKAVNADDAMPLVSDIAASIARNNGSLISLVRLKNKDDYTYMHSVAVCALMIALARELGLDQEQTRQAGMAGLLHDVGKMVIPQDILNKPGALTDEEFSLVKQHPQRGYDLLLQGQGIDQVSLDVCLHHHEKVDGSGYPNQFQGEQISLFARMGAVCDVYDAITSNRPYKAGWEPGVSLQRMAQWKNHFDADVFKAFVKSVGIYPIGSMVKLKSGRLAVVIDQGASSLLTPLVKVFFSTKSNMRIAPQIIDLSKPAAQDQIVSHEDPVMWGIHDVNALWSS